MEVKTIIQEIKRLPLSKKFLAMEQTVKFIKNEELRIKTINLGEPHYKNYNSESTIKDVSYLVSEKSLSNDLLSDEDNRWDKIL